MCWHFLMPQCLFLCEIPSARGFVFHSFRSKHIYLSIRSELDPGGEWCGSVVGAGECGIGFLGVG